MSDYENEAMFCGYALAEYIQEYNDRYNKNIAPTDKIVKRHIKASGTILKADRRTINLVKHYASEKLGV